MITFSTWLEGLQSKPMQVADAFYDYMKGQFPKCELGIAGTSKENPGSGNCAWTAQYFLNWAKDKPNILSRTKIVSFPTTYDEKTNPHGATLGHIVPVYDVYIIDYIRTFTYGRKYSLCKVTNLTPGIHELKDGGTQLYRAYGPKAFEYDYYIVGDSWGQVESLMGQYYKTKNLRIKSFDPPREGGEYEDWQKGKWGKPYPYYGN